MARIQSSTLKELLHRVLRSKADEIGCDTCYESLDRFVDLELDAASVQFLRKCVRAVVDEL